MQLNVKNIICAGYKIFKSSVSTSSFERSKSYALYTFQEVFFRFKGEIEFHKYQYIQWISHERDHVQIYMYMYFGRFVDMSKPEDFRWYELHGKVYV